MIIDRLHDSRIMSADVLAVFIYLLHRSVLQHEADEIPGSLIIMH